MTDLQRIKKTINWLIFIGFAKNEREIAEKLGYKCDMIESPKYADIRKTMLANMLKVLDVEKFMPVMTPEELRGFEQIVSGRKKADFSPLLLEQWQERMQERQDNINEKFTAATAKSEEICKQRKAKK